MGKKISWRKKYQRLLNRLNRSKSKKNKRKITIDDICITRPDVSKGIKFDKKKAMNEAYVQFELYRQLKNSGVEVYPEYKIGNSRADLVIVHDGYIKAAIEVKPKPRKSLNKNTRQYLKYSMLKDIAILYCLGIENLDNTKEYVLKHLLKDEIEPIIKIFNEIKDELDSKVKDGN